MFLPRKARLLAVFDCIPVDRQFHRQGALFVVKSYRNIFWQHIFTDESLLAAQVANLTTID
jgi:hypothetical protein